MHKQILINALIPALPHLSYCWRWLTSTHTHINTHTSTASPPRVLCTFKPRQRSGHISTGLQGDFRGKKNVGRVGVMSIKRTSGNRERVSTSGQGIVSRRPTHSASSIVSPSSSHAPSLSVLREFPSLLPTLCLALSLFALKHTLPWTDTHLHLFSLPLYSHPPQSAVMPATFSCPLIYYRSASRAGPFRKDSVPHLSTQPLTRTKRCK